MHVLLDLLIFLILARVFGSISVQLGLPGSVGEVLSGVIVASVAISYGHLSPFLVELASSEILKHAADVGIFCLMLLSGIETRLEDLRTHSGKALSIAIGGALVPLVTGILLIWYLVPPFEQRHSLALLTGIVLAVTALPAIAKVLQELGLTNTRLGRIIIGAAIFDDVIGLFLLAILVSVIQTGELPGVLTIFTLLVKVIAFFAVTMTLGVHVYPRVSRHLNTLEATSLEFSAMAIVGLAYGVCAEWLGLHWAIGAFVAGLFFERRRVGFRSYNEVRLIFTGLTRGMLAPLFFASIGIHFDPNSLRDAPDLLALLVVTALLGKIAGCGVPALLGGLSFRESMAVGVGMSARGAIGFIVLSVAVSAGLFQALDGAGRIANNLFSGLVLVGIVTTMLVPVMLRMVVRKIRRSDE